MWPFMSLADLSQDAFPPVVSTSLKVCSIVGKVAKKYVHAGTCKPVFKGLQLAATNALSAHIACILPWRFILSRNECLAETRRRDFSWICTFFLAFFVVPL